MKQETRKQEIIITAAKLFKEKGYSAVTMRDLASTLGIKASSLYNHISSKQEILKTIVIAVAQEFTTQMENIIATESTSIEKLHKIIKLHIKIANENNYGLAALNNDWMHLEDKLEYYLKLRNEYEENFRQIIIQGIKNKELKNESPEVMLFSILSTLRSLYLWIPKKEDLNLDELTKNLSSVLINGIKN